MPGSKHVGEDNEVITSKKLNHIEYGLSKASDHSSGGGSLIVHETGEYDPDREKGICTLDTTFLDIMEAARSGKDIYIDAFSRNNERIIFKVQNIYYEIYEDYFDGFAFDVKYHDNYYPNGVYYELPWEDEDGSFPDNGPNSYPCREDTRDYGDYTPDPEDPEDPLIPVGPD